MAVQKENAYQRPRIMDEEFGYESVLRSHNKFIKTRNDIVVLWMHWLLLRNVFKSHGGEGAITLFLTEHLPRSLGWNGDKKTYLLKYEFQLQTYGMGMWIREDIMDASFVTLEKSMKIGIPIKDLVNKDNTLVVRYADDFTKVVEKEFVWPMMPEEEECECEDENENTTDN